MRLTVCNWMDEMRRLSFHDKRIHLHFELMDSNFQHVKVTLEISCFDSVNSAGPPAGHTIPIMRQEIFASHDGEMVISPEEALHQMWQSMWQHEFEEQLQRDGKPVADPHSLRAEPPNLFVDNEMIEAGSDDR